MKYLGKRTTEKETIYHLLPDEVTKLHSNRKNRSLIEISRCTFKFPMKKVSQLSAFERKKLCLGIKDCNHKKNESISHIKCENKAVNNQDSSSFASLASVSSRMFHTPEPSRKSLNAENSSPCPILLCSQGAQAFRNVHPFPPHTSSLTHANSSIKSSQKVNKSDRCVLLLLLDLSQKKFEFIEMNFPLQETDVTVNYILDRIPFCTKTLLGKQTYRGIVLLSEGIEINNHDAKVMAKVGETLIPIPECNNREECVRASRYIMNRPEITLLIEKVKDSHKKVKKDRKSKEMKKRLKNKRISSMTSSPSRSENTSDPYRCTSLVTCSPRDRLIDSPTDIATDSPTNTVTSDSQVDVVPRSPIQRPNHSPADVMTDSPMEEINTDSPGDVVNLLKIDRVIDSPTNMVTGLPTNEVTPDSQADVVTRSPIHRPTNSPTDIMTDLPTDEINTDSPGDVVNLLKRDGLINSSTNIETNLPTNEVTPDSQADVVTRSPVQKPVHSPTDVVTDLPTNAVTPDSPDVVKLLERDRLNDSPTDIIVTYLPTNAVTPDSPTDVVIKNYQGLEKVTLRFDNIGGDEDYVQEAVESCDLLKSASNLFFNLISKVVTFERFMVALLCRSIRFWASFTNNEPTNKSSIGRLNDYYRNKTHLSSAMIAFKIAQVVLFLLLIRKVFKQQKALEPMSMDFFLVMIAFFIGLVWHQRQYKLRPHVHQLHRIMREWWTNVIG